MKKIVLEKLKQIKKRTYIFGILFGLVTPVVGIFAGLQISVMLGNILAFPFLVVSVFSGKPLGFWGLGLWLFSFVFSVVIWVYIFSLLEKILDSQTKTRRKK